MGGVIYYILLIAAAIIAIVIINVAYQVADMFYRKRKMQLLVKDFPGKSPHWLWGNLKDLKRGIGGLMQGLEWRQKYGPMYTVWFGPTAASLQTTHPDYVKVILNTAEPKNPITYHYLLEWIGDGLLISKVSVVTKAHWK